VAVVAMRAYSGSGKLCAAAVTLLVAQAVFIAQPSAQTGPDLLNDDGLFRTVLNKPSNLLATSQYAVQTERLGDLEASIGSLERLLFFNPKLCRVRYEVGTLYFRLGSFEMARGYFQTVLGCAEASQDMQDRAQEFLGVIEKRLQSDQWSGYAQTGFRYQTNASLGPNQQSLIGATRPINSLFVPQADWNWFGAFGVNYVHDFGNQRGDVFEANFLGYDAQQFKVSSVDTGYIDIHAGPRFGIFQDFLTGASIKPYLAMTGVTLADNPYLGSIGGGVTAHINWASIGFDPYVEIRRLSYQNSSLYPLASGLDGTLATYAIQAGGPIVSGIGWQAKLAFNHADDALPWYSYDRYALDVWFPLTIPSLWGGRGWIFTPSFGVARWLYRQPDPILNPFTTEHDLEWRVGAGLDIPIRDQFGLGIQVQYRAFNSNIPTNTVRDLAVSMGPTVRF
jgi:hypothetical protein